MEWAEWEESQEGSESWGGVVKTEATGEEIGGG
jgi:hypothetical protein